MKCNNEERAVPTKCRNESNGCYSDVQGTTSGSMYSQAAQQDNITGSDVYGNPIIQSLETCLWQHCHT